MEGMTTKHPYIDRELLVGLADYVTDDAGTGLVHTAPGYGDDDYNFGKKYNLPIFAPMNDQGVLTAENGPEFDGVFYQDADDISLRLLEERNAIWLFDCGEDLLPDLGEGPLAEHVKGPW